MQRLHNSIVRNPIIPVRFAGFESSTGRLQSAGWQLSMDEQMEFHRAGKTLRLAGKHEQARLYFITNPVMIEDTHFYNMVFEGGNSTMRYFEQRGFDVMFMSPRIECQIMASTTPLSFKAIDAVPFIDQTSERKNIENFALFQPLSPDIELYVPKASVGELLEIIKKKQQPKQKDIRHKKRVEEFNKDMRGQEFSSGYDPRKDIQCQLISIA